jgi:hypothetical protein
MSKEEKQHLTKEKQISIVYSVSVFDLRISTGVNSFCRFIKPNTTAVSGVLQTTFPSSVATFSIFETAYVTALQPNFVPNARSNGDGNPP